MFQQNARLKPSTKSYWSSKPIEAVSFYHGTIIRAGITYKKIFCKGRLNLAYLWSRVRLSVSRKQKYFSLPEQLSENLTLVFVDFYQRAIKG